MLDGRPRSPYTDLTFNGATDMTKPNLSSDIAAFLARGGAIQTVAAGEVTGAVQAAYAAARDAERGREKVDPVDQRIDHGYAVFNGLGEPVYLGR